MTDTEKNEIMANSIVAAVKEHKVGNMTQLAVAMGLLKKGQSVSGSFAKKVKSLVPNIGDLFKENGVQGKPAAKDAKVVKEVAQPKEQRKKDSAKPAKAAKPAKTVKTPKAAKPPKAPKASSPATETTPALYPRHDKNPFRVNSSYAKAFDCFASFKHGVRRDELLTKVAEAVGKDVKHAGYDLSVILSAKESNTGARHQSCREGFWVRRENDHLTIVID